MKVTTDFLTITNAAEFEKVALETFYFQHKQVPIYRRFCELLQVDLTQVKKIEDIPFLPIQFFKTEDVLVTDRSVEKTFNSSGTTGTTTSKHHVSDLSLYEKSFLKGFQNKYGALSTYAILALLPSYLEQGNSSLVYMVDSLIKKTNNVHSGFYLNDLNALITKLNFLERTQQKTILLGVSYALLDLIEQQNFQLKHTIIMETGGMKGRRREMIKAALHQQLQKGFGVSEIHSEYGMTELLSQAYSKGKGIYSCPPWMKVLTRDTEDARSYVKNTTGGINVIDLANVYSCSFVATQDLGKLYNDGTFEVLGRFDNSDIRGCNLMVL